MLLSSQAGYHILDIQSGDIALIYGFEDEEDERPNLEIESWTDDGKYLYISYSASDRWERGLLRYNVETQSSEDLTLDQNLYRNWNISDDASTIVYSKTDGDMPPEVWVSGNSFNKPRRLTELNPWTKDIKLTKSELISYLNVDGKRLYGILYYPIDYDPQKTYPLVAEIYETFFDNGFNANMNLLANQGWFGFRPSVDLEIGFPGEAWVKGVTTAINAVIDRGLVDENKLGVHGTSYGGYATNLLITQTNRFAAAINISGKVNIISFLGDSEKITTRNYIAAEEGQDRIGATLWEQPQKYIAHSAIMFADRIDTPLLMLSGEDDWNVPETNQREMYYALRRLGKKVTWVNYMRAGHGAGRAGTKEDFLDHWNRIFDWYATYFSEKEK
ncbi:MAG TPA: S9 family peptidase [Gemmatimonadetes bacterium]|nr:S9 family peptidase [Gemmatimonadota bacterium]